MVMMSRARHRLQAFRAESHWDERSRQAWCRLWLCRGYAWSCSDLAHDLAYRLIDALAKRYGVPETEMYGCHVGRVVWIDKKWRQAILAREVARMEAECGCELPDLSDPTLSQRAQRLLDCSDPPVGEDRETCLEAAGIEGGRMDATDAVVANSDAEAARILEGRT